MRSSDWSSDVCSSDLRCHHRGVRGGRLGDAPGQLEDRLVLLGQVADGRVLVAAAVIAHAPKARGVGRSAAGAKVLTFGRFSPDVALVDAGAIGRAHV